MNKTNKLFEKYLGLYLEQEPGEAPAPGEVAPAEGAPPEPATEGPKPLSENEKYIIKILTNAFIFNPTLFDKNKQNFIDNKINELKNTVNVPVSKIIDDIKKILAFDRSLAVESKTNSLLKKYFRILEQGEKDATEPQAGGEPPAEAPAPEAPPEDNKNKLDLTEIFPLYKELLLKALKHIPTEEELMMLKPVVNEFADVDPEKIVEVIENLLSQSLEDREVEDNLSNV